MTTIDPMLADAISRGLPEPVEPYLLARHSAVASTRSEPQVYSSTTGPLAGDGGSAMTTGRTTAVRLNERVHLYHDGSWVLTLNATMADGEKAWQTCQIPQMSTVDEAAVVAAVARLA